MNNKLDRNLGKSVSRGVVAANQVRVLSSIRMQLSWRNERLHSLSRENL